MVKGDGRPREDAKRAFAELRVPVAEACRRHEDWPEKVAAAVYAALDFVVDDPARAATLFVIRDGSGDDRPLERMVDHFADLLQRVSPRMEHAPIPSSRGPIAGIAVVVADYVRSGNTDRLEQIGPELVQFALVPYLGFAEAKQWLERPT